MPGTTVSSRQCRLESVDAWNGPVWSGDWSSQPRVTFVTDKSFFPFARYRMRTKSRLHG